MSGISDIFFLVLCRVDGNSNTQFTQSILSYEATFLQFFVWNCAIMTDRVCPNAVSIDSTSVGYVLLIKEWPFN